MDEPQQPNVPINLGSDQSTTLMGVRHDGWTGDKMATFCETLAETAVVAEACEAARMGNSVTGNSVTGNSVTVH